MVLEYMQSALAMQTQLKGNSTGVPPEITTAVGVMPFAPQAKYSLGHTDDGFPVLPRPMDTQGWTKRDWERLHKEYMSCHYSEWRVGPGTQTGIDMTI
jgi:hypothetical protein